MRKYLVIYEEAVSHTGLRLYNSSLLDFLTRIFFFFISVICFAEQFNILWKPNWTREAEKVLKIFERDVILKVK
jgi:hypothetical protein